jgi:hypothetical protein
MLIDENENQDQNELEAVGQEISKLNEEASNLPEKYRNKSLEEVIKMHQEAEKLIGKQAQEVGEVRKLADELIKSNLATKQQQVVQEEPEVDFFEDPRKAVQKTVETHPDVLAARQAAQEFKKMQVQQKLQQAHPDFAQIVQDPGFAEWVKGSSVRMSLYSKADAEFDFDSANELLSTYKELRGVRTKQTEAVGKATREKDMKTATVDVGGTGESSKRVYRRADLIRLKMTDPARYDALQPEIMAAYADGRVR